MDWLPITDAPRDGTRMLASIKHGIDWQVVIAEFSANGCLYDEREGSCVGWDPRGSLGSQAENRPMWMPLPAPHK